MYYDPAGFSANKDSLKSQFQEMNENLDEWESVLASVVNDTKSPMASYFSTLTKSLATNHDILNNHFRNIQDYLDLVQETYS